MNGFCEDNSFLPQRTTAIPEYQTTTMRTPDHIFVMSDTVFHTLERKRARMPIARGPVNGTLVDANGTLFTNVFIPRERVTLARAMGISTAKPENRAPMFQACETIDDILETMHREYARGEMISMECISVVKKNSARFVEGQRSVWYSFNIRREMEQFINFIDWAREYYDILSSNTTCFEYKTKTYSDTPYVFERDGKFMAVRICVGSRTRSWAANKLSLDEVLLREILPHNAPIALAVLTLSAYTENYDFAHITEHELRAIRANQIANKVVPPEFYD